MVQMDKIVAAAAAAIVVIAVVTWLVRRRSSDEVHSVDGYRHTLDTLQGIRARSGSGTVRVLGGTAPGGAPAPGGDGGVPGAGTRSPADDADGGSATGPDRPLLFDEGEPAASATAASRRSRRNQDRAISAMNHRPRHLGGPALVAVVVLALLALVLVLGAHSHRPTAQGTSRGAVSRTTTTSTARRSGPGSTTTTGAGSGTRSGGRGASTSTPKSTTTTTTTLPQTYTAVTYTTTTATYTPPSGSYTLTLAATTGSCWLTVKSAGGAVLLSQTLTAGQAKPVTTSGQTTIVVGAPTVVRVTIDHRPVALPTGYQTPFTITLAPAP